MLVLAGHFLFSDLAFTAGIATGAQLLGRVKSNVSLPLFAEQSEGSYLSGVRPGSHADHVGQARASLYE